VADRDLASWERQRPVEPDPDNAGAREVTTVRSFDRSTVHRGGIGHARSSGLRQVIVLAGGDDFVPRFVRPLAPDAQVIAADGGLALAGALGLEVDLVVGDLDSVQPSQLRAAEAAGTRIERHPVDKDRTDLAIALDAVAAAGPAELTVIGGHGGRLDHLLAGAMLLASPAYRSLTITAHMGPAIVTVIRDAAELLGDPGELVSLVPVHGAVLGVTTEGLRFPLIDGELSAGSSRGVSNVFADPVARVSRSAGVLLAIQPGEQAPTRTDDGVPPR
jgi:thiamine pyrophosphokinase